jgi:hypothetical protein
VAPLAGPFRVTSQNVSQVIFGTTKQNVTWDVAGTNASPINVANVKISLSTDGGLTFPTVLAESTPNDGSAEVTFPSVNASKARIKVEAIGNVFFDVSHADVSLTAAPTAPVGGTVPATLALTLGAAPSFGAFTPGVAKDYFASSELTVTSSAGDAALIVQDASPFYTNRLVNGTFALANELQVKNNAGAYQTMPAGLRFWGGPTASEKVPLELKQSIGANDPLRSGSYSKTLTFSLSTTTP